MLFFFFCPYGKQGRCTSSGGDVGLQLLARIELSLELLGFGVGLELGVQLRLSLKRRLGLLLGQRLRLAESLQGGRGAGAGGRLGGQLRQLLAVGQRFQHSVLPLQHRVPLKQLLDLLF